MKNMTLTFCLVPMRPSRVLGFTLVALALGALIAFPEIDLVAAGWFYENGKGFTGNALPLAKFLHLIATDGAKVFGVFLLLALLGTAILRKPFLGMGAKEWLFLLAGLIVAPGLLANSVFKDHWGRARPHQIEEFGGTARFTPPVLPSDQCQRNCSFVAGDPSFGFYLHALFYVVPRRYARRAFLGGLAAGTAFGLARMAMGAHFFSDVVFAAVAMLGATALLHATLFGLGPTKTRWRQLTFRIP